MLEIEVPLNFLARPLPSHSLLVTLRGSAPLGDEALRCIADCVRRIVTDHSQASVGKLHDLVISAAHSSRDLTSFLDRCIKTVLLPEFRFEGVSIFYHEQKTNSLILGATTGIGRQENLGLKRSDIRYFTDDKSFMAKCWRWGREIVENVFEARALRRNTMGEKARTIHSRIYAPLRRWNGAEASKPGSIGVIRAINANKDNNFHPLTVLEVARLRVFCDAASIIAERYLRAVSILHDQERATHGYNTDLAAIKYAAENVNRWLGRAEAESTTPAQREVAIQEIRYRIRDILAVQDNMAA